MPGVPVQWDQLYGRRQNNQFTTLFTSPTINTSGAEAFLFLFLDRKLYYRKNAGLWETVLFIAFTCSFKSKHV